MQSFIAYSLICASTAQVSEICDICQGREITPGARVFDNEHDCAETVPWCADPAQGMAHCGGTCDVVISLVMPECCPPPEDELCDICEGRPVLDISPDGVATCAGTVEFCTMNLGACGGTCANARAGVGGSCCPPEPCDICQGGSVIDMVLPNGYTCEESVNYCSTNIAGCPDLGATCSDVQVNLGGPCCEGGAPETGAADEQPAAEQPADEQTTDSEPADAQATTAATTTTIITTTTAEDRSMEVQPTEQPLQQEQPVAAEDEDGFESSAIAAAEAKLTAFLLMALTSMLC